MAFFNWSRWFRSLSRPNLKPIRKRTCTPRLEALEDRLAPASFTWTGNGADANWGTGANWSGGVAPTGAGTDDLVFPLVAARPANTNNLSGASFNSISIQGSNYSLVGNPITLGSTAPQSS